MNRTTYALAYIMLLLVSSCRKDEEVIAPETEKVADADKSVELAGFYLLNEGNMGSNKCTLDYYDFASGVYSRNIYASANPTMVQELGDVGNDLQIYGDRLYAVVNCSNIVEVMDAKTARHIGTIEVPNCRYVQFDGPHGYITSYAGPVSINPDYEQHGYVAKFDTATLSILDTCTVGFQPDELAIADGKIFVANSGGYMAPKYDNTVSVIDLESMTKTTDIVVCKNLHRLRTDAHGQLWVSSRGDYLDLPSKLYCIDRASLSVSDSINVSVADLDVVGDSIYVLGSEFSYESYDWQMSYTIVNAITHEVVCRNFITDGSDAKIKKPYGLKVNPLTRDIYITDAKNYVSPGVLYCFSPDGILRWTVSTGDIPAHFAFLSK